MSTSVQAHSNGLFKAMPMVVDTVMKEDSDIEAGYYFHNKKLGEGGFSKVRLATHIATGEKVAIKCMEKLKLGNDLFRVKTEIHALKNLQHNNIAKLYQVIETDKSIYLVLEYCSGGELFDYIVAKQRLSENESRGIMRSLIQCLAYIHEKGYAHRDLKPENILFDSNHNVKLIDFGLAAHPSDSAALSHLETCCGSPAYAAPELIAGHKYSGPAVDVWSAGILLYALLVGQLPFDDENITNLYKKIKTGVFLIPVWLSHPARNLIRSMLQVDPKKRVAVKDLLKNDWINNGNKDPIVIYREHLDEEIVWDVSKIFKRMPVALLRQNVISGLGYQRATYWILRSRKEKGCSQAVVPMYSSPKSKQTFITKSTDTVLEQIREEKEVAAEHDYVNVTKSNEALSSTSEGRPSVVAQQMKRKLVTNEHHFTVYDKEDNPTPAKARYTPSKVRQNPRCVPKPPTAPSTPARMSTPLKERTTPAPLAVTKTTEIPVPKTPNKVLSPVDINRKKTFTLLNTPKDKSMISPTPNRRMKMLFGKSPLKENPELETPSKMLIPSTPKRSLMKRILAAATPSDKPRMLSTRTTAKNITMTNFNDAQECINKLIQVISQKGYHCKQKGYTISCAKVNKYTGDDHISFDLEICQFADRCAIQRKRLRGDAWFYKKICEEILRVSNGEHVMESQV